MTTPTALLPPVTDVFTSAIDPANLQKAAPVPWPADPSWDANVYPILLSVFAGLSTSIGGGIAVLKKPDDSLLAFLLGMAIGVMATLASVELYLFNIFKLGFMPVTAVFATGVLTYYGIHHFFPVIDPTSSFPPKQLEHPLVRSRKKETRTADREVYGEEQDFECGTATGSQIDPNSNVMILPSGDENPSHRRRPSTGRARVTRLSQNELWRLGVLMGITMTLHNFPEGFAVAFSAFTDLGPVVATSIAMHNIPEGIIVAAPVFAATGSRWKALGMSFASGMSEPLGAFLALSLLGSYLTTDRLEYLLVYVGGIMVAVCTAELWPEARKCASDVQMLRGLLLGSLLIGVTLYVGH